MNKEMAIFADREIAFAPVCDIVELCRVRGSPAVGGLANLSSNGSDFCIQGMDLQAKWVSTTTPAMTSKRKISPAQLLKHEPVVSQIARRIAPLARQGSGFQPKILYLPGCRDEPNILDLPA